MKVELRRVRHATPGARDARRRWPERERLLLRISDARGGFGLGEAAPLPGYSPDAIDAVEAALRAVEPAAMKRVLDSELPAGDTKLAFATLGRVSSLLPETLPSARMALETAALDWLSRRERVSAPELLGASPSATAVLAHLAGPAAASDLLPRVAAARRLGYTHFKLKVGAPQALREEVAGILSLRQTAGASVSLRLDANGAWTAEQVSEAFRRLEPAGIELFEEPGAVPSALVGILPLALDESLQSLDQHEAARLVSARSAAAVVLKPTALGGLAYCFELAELVRSGGARVVVSHCFEGTLAFRAAAALALALRGELAQGLAPHAGLNHPVPVEAGSLRAWSDLGLGEPGGFD